MIQIRIFDDRLPEGVLAESLASAIEINGSFEPVIGVTIRGDLLPSGVTPDDVLGALEAVVPVELFVPLDTFKDMSDADFYDLARPAMEDTTPLPVQIDVMSAWFLVCALQLACRHPNLGDGMRARLYAIAQQFQQQIALRHPAAAPALELGWDTGADVDAGTGGQP